MENFIKSHSEERCSLNFIRRNLIGDEAVVKGPFGFKKLVYCDYVASGKPLKCIEDYIQKYVHPYYANTHTTTSFAARQTTKYREDARNIIKSCLNCGDDDVLIFCGNGATGAVHKLIHALAIKEKAAEDTVVLTGPFEHHSNILPWKETGCTVDRISCNDKGMVDLVALEIKLQHYSKQPERTLIVAMSAASNVTGIMTDTKTVAKLSHKYGAVSIWDYAAGAPYLSIDMNPSKNGYKDAVFISPHKFCGGVGTPGILVAKKHLFVNRVPHGCGGGTVNWVTRGQHEYLEDIEEKEEGGTPAIIESIRAGLTFQIKKAVGQEVIDEREEYLCKRAMEKWSKNENIVILGNLGPRRLPIFSFLVLHQRSGLYLHHNFVSVLLNDLYGIQSRGGCACAGPYAQDLLNMSEDIAGRFINLSSSSTVDGNNTWQIMKPGFCRLNIPYFASEDTIQYILEAVDQVALYGWMLLPLYRFKAGTGEWYHHSNNQAPSRSLQEITYSRAGMVVKDLNVPVYNEGDVNYADMLADATTTIIHAQQLSAAMADFSKDSNSVLNLSKDDYSLLWFLEPKHAFTFLKTYGIGVLDLPPDDMYYKDHMIEVYSKPSKKALQPNLTTVKTGLNEEQMFVPSWQQSLIANQKKLFFRNQMMFIPHEKTLTTAKNGSPNLHPGMTFLHVNNDTTVKPSVGTNFTIRSHKKGAKGCVIA